MNTITELINNWQGTAYAVGGAVAYALTQLGWVQATKWLTDPEKRKELARAKQGYVATKALRLWLIEEGFTREQSQSLTWQEIEDYVAERNSGWPRK